MLIVIGKWGEAYACKVQTPKDHHLYSMRQDRWSILGPILPFKVTYLPFYIKGSKTEKNFTGDGSSDSQLYIG